MIASFRHLAPRPHRAGAAALLCLAALTFSHAALAATRPDNFEVNASTDIGSGLRCVVGSATDADGMNARAWITVEDTVSHTVRWASAVPLRNDWYQNQATHCLRNGDIVLAVVQSDTMSQAATSQTFVDVVSLTTATGQIQSRWPVKVPKVKGAVSLRVDNGAENFQLVDGSPIVKGRYFLLSNRDDIEPFTVSPTHAPLSP